MNFIIAVAESDNRYFMKVTLDDKISDPVEISKVLYDAIIEDSKNRPVLTTQ